MHGPMGQNVSKPLARVNWTSRACSWRAVTSFTQQKPKMQRDASAGESSCQVSTPITMPSSAS